MEPNLRAVPDGNDPYKWVEELDLTPILEQITKDLEDDPTFYTMDEVFGPLFEDAARRRAEREALDEAV